MKHFHLILVCASLFGFHFSIAKGVTVADIICIFLFFVSIYNLTINKWRIDTFCKYNIIYLLSMILSCLFNQTYDNTVFLNYFRIYIYGIIIYLCTYNSLHNKKDFLFFIYVLSTYLIYFLIGTREFMSSSFRGDITNTFEFTSQISYGRNAWGFTALLIAFFSIYLYQQRFIKSYILYSIIGLTFFCIILSVSRFSAISFIILVLWAAYINKTNISTSNIIKTIAGSIVVIYIFRFFTSNVSGDILSYGYEFFFNKLEKTSNDIEDVRIEELNFLPIKNWFSNNSPIKLLWGDGIFIGHSIIAHTLISTGIVGFICYIAYNFKYVYLCIRDPEKNLKYFMRI